MLRYILDTAVLTRKHEGERLLHSFMSHRSLDLALASAVSRIFVSPLSLNAVPVATGSASQVLSKPSSCIIIDEYSSLQFETKSDTSCDLQYRIRASTRGN